MANHTFTNWLKFEIHSARCALLRLYEEEEKLKYIEGPRLERAYMDTVGKYEEQVVKEEMECELLTAKQKLVQTAINRREAIDEAAIDQKIDEMREEMMKDAAGEPLEQNYAKLTNEQSGELQKIYSKIVESFHPSMHPEMTATERMLYQKAQDAYRMRDLPALNLIWEMLTGGDGEGIELTFTMTLANDDGEGDAPSRDYSTDYSLASQLYERFVPLQEEAPILEEWKNYTNRTNNMMERLAQMKQEFPFTAEEMLSDPKQIEEYKHELEQRMRDAQKERAQLTQDIQTMIGGATIRE